MKKINLIGMFALTFALVFGAVACSNNASSSSGTDLKDALKDKDLSLKGDWDLTDVSWDEEFGEPAEVSYDGDPKDIWDNYTEGTAPTTVEKKEDYIKEYNEANEMKYDDEDLAKAWATALVASYDTKTMQSFYDTVDKAANDNKANGDGVTQKTEIEASAVIDGDSTITVSSTMTITYTKGDATFAVTTESWKTFEKK